MKTLSPHPSLLFRKAILGKAGPLAVLLGIVLLLAACAGRPAFETLNARVVPQAPLEVGANAELRIALESLTASGERGELIAESLYSNFDGSPMAVALRFDARALDADSDYRLIAQVRENGRIVHANAEDVVVSSSDIATETVEIPLAAR